MSDPYSVIAAIVLATTGTIGGTNVPDTIKDQAIAVVRSAGDTAAALMGQVDNAVSQMPEPARQVAQQGIESATEQVAAAIPQPAPAPNAETTPPAADTKIPGPQSVNESQSTGGVGAARSTSTLPTTLSIMPISQTRSGTFATFVPWLKKAGALCTGVGAPTLAALYSAENGFRYGPDAPVSPAGARGPGQFMESTWKVYGKDVEGKGFADILGVADSVMASGHLLCDTYSQIESWKAHGLVAGDTLDLTIAAYNAGAGAVLQSGGMPAGKPDYENQTKPYVARIRATEAQFGWMLSPLSNLPISGVGTQIVDQAMKYLGLPYVWGGGGSDGPTNGGFDCSGLTSFAVHAASGGAITLPRTSETQWSVGTEIPLASAAPGDLLFGNWGPSGPGHVAIYVGANQMIQAPTTGDVVRISTVPGDMRARRVL